MLSSKKRRELKPNSVRSIMNAPIMSYLPIHPDDDDDDDDDDDVLLNQVQYGCPPQNRLHIHVGVSINWLKMRWHRAV